MNTFVFSRYEADWSTGDLGFYYEIVKDDERIPFVERWQISSVPDNFQQTEEVEHALQALHLIIGTSYYKVFCPPSIEIKGYSLSKDQAEVWNTIYTKGLGEFFYKNQIDYRDLINFPFDEQEEYSANEINLEEKALVLHGGGKDSIVSAEMVRHSNIPFDLFCLRPEEVQLEVAKVMGKEIHAIKRIIDPKLLSLNKTGGVYNGHVPITTFYTFASTLMAILGRYKYVVVSSERSSSYGNVSYLGDEINHQWSKSEEAEDLLRTYIKKYVAKNVEYFSMLRPWYEIKVGEKFSEYSQYFEVFSSSNHNFKLAKERGSQRWEYASPKTLFVFAILSAFLSKADMVRIFGDNLYDKSELLPILHELLGLTDIKPFECVGTPEEMMVAMKMAYDKGEYIDSVAMHMFEEKILSQHLDFDRMKEKVFTEGDRSRIPDIFLKQL
jgi:hypothetical protein